MVAWAAVTGTTPVAAWILFAVIFLWTPPHFWALALCKEGDYARAGVPMMPNVKGDRSTRRQIFAYALILAPIGAAPFFAGVGGFFYLAVSCLLGARFVQHAFKVFKDQTGETKAAMDLFKFSIPLSFRTFRRAFKRKPCPNDPLVRHIAAWKIV